jgi:hypothetical protein
MTSGTTAAPAIVIAPVNKSRRVVVIGIPSRPKFGDRSSPLLLAREVSINRSARQENPDGFAVAQRSSATGRLTIPVPLRLYLAGHDGMEKPTPDRRSLASYLDSRPTTFDAQQRSALHRLPPRHAVFD